MSKIENATQKPRAVLLYRASSKKQTDSENDIPLQRDILKPWAEQNGWEFVCEKIEGGVSGYKVSAAKRDAIIEIKAMAERDEFDILGIYMSDRLGRIAEETPLIVSFLNERGIKVMSYSEGEITANTHADKLMTYIRYWQAEGESLKTSMRVTDAGENCVKAGKWRGGNPPYGYHSVSRGTLNYKGKPIFDIEIHPKQAEVVKTVFRLYTEEHYGSRLIAKHLNDNGHKTRDGHLWNGSLILKMIKNKMYMGIYELGKWTKNRPIIASPVMEHLIIIDEKTFEKAQKVRAANNLNPEAKQRQTVRGALLLTGLLYCGECGKKFSSHYHHHKRQRKDGSVWEQKINRYRCSWEGRFDAADLQQKKSILLNIIEKILVFPHGVKTEFKIETRGFGTLQAIDRPDWMSLPTIDGQQPTPPNNDSNDRNGGNSAHNNKKEKNTAIPHAISGVNCSPQASKQIPFYTLIKRQVDYNETKGLDEIDENSGISKAEQIFKFCNVPRSSKEIGKLLGINTVWHVNNVYINPLVKKGQLVEMIPNYASNLQKYVAAEYAPLRPTETAILEYFNQPRSKGEIAKHFGLSQFQMKKHIYSLIERGKLKGEDNINAKNHWQKFVSADSVVPISKYDRIIEFCKTPKDRSKIAEYLGLHLKYVYKYINPLVEQGKLKMTMPLYPTSSKQKYYSNGIDVPPLSEGTIADFCNTSKSRKEIAEHFEVPLYTIRDYLNELTKKNILKMTIPINPDSKMQKFAKTYTDILCVTEENILYYCQTPRTNKEITAHFGHTTINIMWHILTTLIKLGKLKTVFRGKRNCKNQKYISTKCMR